MPFQELHKNAFWIYGLVVGLAIREPLTHLLPDLMSQGWSWRVQLETWRFALFLLMVVRYYLGSSSFFYDVYFRPDTAYKYKRKRYPMDFTSGLFHFLLFFGWSMTISRHERLGNEVSFYEIALSAVLLYDNIWCLASKNCDTKPQVLEWTIANDIAALCSLLLAGVSRLAGGDPVFSEHLAVVPVLRCSPGSIFASCSLNISSPKKRD